MSDFIERDDDQGLYVEDSFDQVSSFLYCEALTVRSEKHDWRIKPHRHRNLFQIFVVTEGGGNVQLDHERQAVAAPFIIFIPHEVVHSFDWQVSSSGYVLSVASSAMQQIAQNIELQGFMSEAAVNPMNNRERQVIEGLCLQLSAEEQASQPMREHMLMTLLNQLLINTYRMKPSGDPHSLSLTKSERKLADFKALIKQHVMSQHQVAWYADKIGVSAPHLNQICQKYAETSALSLIHKEISDEAKRLLIFADLRVTAIAERLGFQEQTYFTKFFKKFTGLTPSSYRKYYR